LIQVKRALGQHAVMTQIDSLRKAIGCPLWVKSGRDAPKFRCPLYPESGHCWAQL